MPFNNQSLLRISLALNAFLLICGLIGVVKYTKISDIINKLAREHKSISNSNNISSTQRRYNTYQTSYHKLRLKNFQELPNSNDEIIFLGDSLTDQSEWSEILKNHKIKNRGISGDTTDGILDRIDEIIEANPKKVFLLIGTNDLWNERKTVDQIIQNYRLILNTFQQKTPTTKVYIQSLLPVNNEAYDITVSNEDIKMLNAQFKELASKFSYQYIDLFKYFVNQQNQLDLAYTIDGAHLTGKGYLLWAKVIEKYVKE